MTPRYEPWEDALIVERYQADGPEKLALKMPGRTRQGIHSRAGVLGVRAPKAPDWTLREDNILRRYHPDFAKVERLLVHRTRDAIQTRSQTLGLGRYKPWRPHEKEVFRKVAALHSDSEIAAMLGRTATSVEAYRLKHSKVRRHGKKAPIVPVINDVYDLATRRGVVISKLASALGCGRIKRGDARHRMSITAVAAIVEVLGGELYAEWGD